MALPARYSFVRIPYRGHMTSTTEQVKERIDEIADKTKAEVEKLGHELAEATRVAADKAAKLAQDAGEAVREAGEKLSKQVS